MTLPLEALSHPLVDEWKNEIKKLTTDTPIETMNRIVEEAENDGPMNDIERRPMEAVKVDTQADLGT